MNIRFLYPTTLICGLCIVTSGYGEVKVTNQPSPEVKEKSMTTNKSTSGLSWIVLQKPADGAKKPKKGNRVTVHYTGWLYDATAPDNKGDKFDSSIDRGQSFQFTIGIGQVIKGWDEGVALMAVGERRRLIIPADIAYGSRAVGGKIPANAILVFDVELIAVD